MSAPQFLIALALFSSLGTQVAAATELSAVTLEAAERRWIASDVHSYAFTLTYVTFVAPCRSPTIHVRVAKDVPRRRSDKCKELRPKFGTVPLLFSYLHRAVSSDHHLIEAEFDSQYGYPRKIYVNWSGSVDDFETILVTGFHAARK